MRFQNHYIEIPLIFLNYGRFPRMQHFELKSLIMCNDAEDLFSNVNVAEKRFSNVNVAEFSQ